MRLRVLYGIAIFFVGTLTLAACGGGGSSPPPTSSASGVVSAGLVRNGVIKAYAVDSNGVRGVTPIGTTTTDTNGNYSLNFGNYAGAVLVELEGGATPVSKYTDEATGADVTLPVGAVFLRAAVSNVAVGVPVTISLTPLTELAVLRATVANKTLPTAIAAANQIVSDLFKVDIIGVRPVAPTQASLTAATDPQRTYTLALAALSKQAGGATTAAVTAGIDVINGGIGATNVMNATTANNLKTALIDYLNSGSNTTGFTTTSPLVADLGAKLGIRTATITFTAAGVAGHNVGSIDAQVSMPASGYTFATDNNGLVLPTDLMTTSPGTYARARFATQILSIGAVKADPLADGTFLQIKFQADPGFDATTLQLGSIVYKDLNGNEVSINGATVTVTVQ